MKPTFRSEAFIVPITKKADKNVNNVIDDLKISKMQFCESIEMFQKDKINDNKRIEFNNDNENTTVNIDKSCNLNSNVCLPSIRIDNITLIEEEKWNEETKLEENELKLNTQSDVLCNPEEHVYDVPFSYLKKQAVSVKNNCSEEIGEEETFKPIDLEEPIYDVPYSGNKARQSDKLRERFEIGEYVSLQMISKQKTKKKYFPNPPIRTSSLKSIDEREEILENCNDELCCHGYKYGCTIAIKRPEEISEDIFQVRWMKKLEQLRAREAIIKDKETLLDDREKLLFKKERELRILERLLKDKLQYADLYLKRCKSHSHEFIHDYELENKFVAKHKNLHLLKTDFTGHVRSLESLESRSKTDQQSIDNINREFVTQEILKSCGSLNSGISLTNEKSLKNPPNSRSSLMTASLPTALQLQQAKTESEFSHFTSKHSFPGFSAYDSTRMRRRPKVSYDDLDSTLSADIGDSSFVVTSKKFDPGVFKKPHAFTRSLSERRPRPVSERISDSQDEEKKLLKRISDNIFGSYDGKAKFQNYGLIDVKTESNENIKEIHDNNDSKPCSSNFEDEKKKKSTLRNKKNKKFSKDRPFSWNEETDEWLQKKRQAYNMQTAKRMLQSNFENKENHGSHLKLSNEVQKKISKEKKFNIF